MTDTLEVLNIENIIGEENQTMQIILKKNDKIFLNKQYITYSSSDDLDEVVYKSVDSLINSNVLIGNLPKEKAPLKKIENESIVRLKNKNEHYEYIGLSRGGKIMKIYPFLYSKMYIKTESILAFSENVEVLEDKEQNQKMKKLFQGRLFKINNFRDLIKHYSSINPFCLVKSKYYPNEYCMNTGDNNSIQNENPLSLFHVTSYINDYVYISGKNNLIEKRLGENESIVLNIESIILFENTVSFSGLKKDNKNLYKYVNPVCDIVVEGPGLVVFEPVERYLGYMKNQINKGLAVTTILFLIIELLTQIFIHNNMQNNNINRQ